MSKIYLVMQHDITTNQTCVAGIFTKLEDAEKLKNWFNDGDYKRIFYIMERILFDNFDKKLFLGNN